MTAVPLIDVDLWSDVVLVDPYATYARLRDIGPVLYDAERQVFVLTHYDEIGPQEMKAVLEQLAERVEQFEIGEAVWRRNNGLHGLERLVVTVR